MARLGPRPRRPPPPRLQKVSERRGSVPDRSGESPRSPPIRRGAQLLCGRRLPPAFARCGLGFCDRASTVVSCLLPHLPLGAHHTRATSLSMPMKQNRNQPAPSRASGLPHAPDPTSGPSPSRFRCRCQGSLPLEAMSKNSARHLYLRPPAYRALPRCGADPAELVDLSR